MGYSSFPASLQQLLLCLKAVHLSSPTFCLENTPDIFLLAVTRCSHTVQFSAAKMKTRLCSGDTTSDPCSLGTEMMDSFFSQKNYLCTDSFFSH